MHTIATRVARGADWLDLNYPTWWEQIDLATLNIASCSDCVLGQIYTRVIPTEERAGIVAQVLRNMHPFERGAFAEAVAEAAVTPGFNILVEKHAMWIGAQFMGFSLPFFSALGTDGNPTAVEEMAALTDEWTRVIIERRINANLAEVSALWALNRAEVGAQVAA